LLGCATSKTSWYDEMAGGEKGNRTNTNPNGTEANKKGDARRRAKFSGEYRVFELKAAFFAPLKNLGRADAGAVKPAAAAVHFGHVKGASSLRRRCSAQRRC
jgi:hypothetical protein